VSVSAPLESFRLVVFQAVAERLSFTQAAEALRLSQPAVTSHIKALEDDLGVRLFDRSGGKVTITSAGRLLVACAKEMQRLSQDVLHEIGRLNGEERGKLVLAASTTIAQYVLPRLLVDFTRLHPRVEVSIRSANTQDTIDAVTQTPTMLGLIAGPSTTSELKTEDFLDAEIVVMVPSGHRWGRRLDFPPTLQDLAEEPMVMREPGSGTRRMVEDALRKAGVSLRDLRVVMELDSTEAIKTSVEAGLGVGFVPRCALRADQMGENRVVNVDGLRIAGRFQFLYPRGPQPDGVAGAFLRHARQLRAAARSLAVA